MPPSPHCVSARIAMTRRSGGQQTRRGTYANGSSNFATVTRHRPTTRTAVRESRLRTSANSSPLQRLTDMSPVRPARQPGGPTGRSATKAKQPARMTTPNTQATATAKDGAQRYRSCKPRGNATPSAGQPSSNLRSTGQQTSQGSWRGETAITSITRRIWLPNTRWTECSKAEPEVSRTMKAVETESPRRAPCRAAVLPQRRRQVQGEGLGREADRVGESQSVRSSMTTCWHGVVRSIDTLDCDASV